MPDECPKLDACCQSPYGYEAASCEDIDYGNVTPEILNNATSWFNDSESLPAGNYRIYYFSGALQYEAGSDFQINKDAINRFYVYYNDGTQRVPAPGAVWEYATQSDLEIANAGQYVNIVHGGGRIGAFLFDEDYSDNVAGDPSATFQLVKVCEVVSPPPLPPEPDPEGSEYLLNTDGYQAIFTLPADNPPFGYKPTDLASQGIAIWLLTSPTQRELIHFYANADFTEGDILDFTAYMAVSPVTDPVGVARDILITVVGLNCGGTYEIPVNMSIETGGSGVTITSYTGLPVGDVPNDYSFAFIQNSMDFSNVTQDYSDGAAIDDYTNTTVQFGIATGLPPL